MRAILTTICFALLLGCSAKPSLKGEPHEWSSNLGWKARVQPENLDNYIEWREAVSHILSGHVESIWEGHTLEVLLTMKDGTSYSSIQPDIDTVLYIINYCGEKCAGITYMVE